MELNIKTADNGYILEYYDPEIKEKRYIAVEDLEKGKDCISEARLTLKLLWEILEHFGIYGSKHDEERIHVSVINQKGEEVEL